MNRFFTLKHYAFLCFVLLFTITANSQTNANTTTCQTPTNGTCAIPVTNSYNSSDEGFIGSGASPIIAYNSTGGNLRAGGASASTTSGNSNYIITSPNLIADGDVTVGFTLGGTAAISTITVDVLNTAGTITLASCGLTGYNLAGGSVCFKFSDLDLVGQTVKFRITLRTRPAAQNGAGTLTFDDFRVVFASLTVTPVTFGSFEGRKTEIGTQLTWKVAGESNVKQYEVERSTTDTKGFVKIGSVPATGNSSYTFTDATVFSNTIIYRIKNVDNDGRFKYSTLLYFKNGASTVMFRVLPTVVTSNTTVEHSASSGNDVITLSTIDGKILRRVRPATGAMQTAVDMSGLRPGLYLLKWSDGSGNVEVAKVIKQ